MSKQTARSGDWHTEDIKAAIRKKGTTLAELARHHGYSNPGPFYNALKVPYPKVERIIARFLDLEPASIWPSRYEKPTVDFKTSARTSHASHPSNCAA